MKRAIIATVFLIVLAIAGSVVFSQTGAAQDSGSGAIDAAVQTEGPSIWVVILMISLGVLIIVFIILYLKNQQMHKTIKNVNRHVQAYESQVTDLMADHNKAREHLHAKTRQKHPRYHVQPNPQEARHHTSSATGHASHSAQGHLRGMSHDHHTLSQLHNYIEHNLRKGYSRKEIREVLLKQGWTDNDILDAYRLKGFGGQKHRVESRSYYQNA